MNKRQKKKLEKQAAQPHVSGKTSWAQLKHLGGDKRDTYAVVKKAQSWGDVKFLEGDRLRVCEDFEESGGYTWLQRKKDVADQKDFIRLGLPIGGTGYPFDEDEFEIIWKDGAPV